MARLIVQRAGLPDCVTAQTVNRYCSSGLQTIATAANAIRCGEEDVVIAGGVESMSLVPVSYTHLDVYKRQTLWRDIYLPGQD